MHCWNVIRNQKLYSINSIDDELNKALKGRGFIRIRPVFRVEGNVLRAIGISVGNNEVKNYASVSYNLETGKLVFRSTALCFPQ